MQKIFSYIQICIELKAVFLSGNQIITRDLPYIKHLVNLRKADLSNNKIHFLPDDCSLEKLTKL
jgi:Leucine-rich repeat (LRR) protein